VSFEISARRALLDDAIEEAAKVIWQDLQGEFDPRTELIERFVEVNDLIEENVAGAMNHCQPAAHLFFQGDNRGNEMAIDGSGHLVRQLSVLIALRVLQNHDVIGVKNDHAVPLRVLLRGRVRRAGRFCRIAGGRLLNGVSRRRSACCPGRCRTR